MTDALIAASRLDTAATNVRTVCRPTPANVAAVDAAHKLMTTAAYVVAILCFTAAVVTAATKCGAGPWLARSWRSRLAWWRGTTLNTASAHEVTAVCAVSVVGAMLVIGATAATSEDDVVDAAALAVLAVVAATIGATLATLGALLAYVATPVATPDAWRKVVFDDAVNFGLYVLRVFLCWTRYIFYDLQVEGVDMALQQSDALFTSSTSAGRTPVEVVVWAAFDVVADVAQLGLSLAKLFLAAFLLWLVVDLFILRPLAVVATRWAALRL
jgi:hypothetical protein